jgi:hypothetical protein
LQGETEAHAVEFAAQSGGNVEAQAVRPGIIDVAGQERRNVPNVPNVALDDVAATVLDQLIHGFEKDPLRNDDLVRIAKKASAEH